MKTRQELNAWEARINAEIAKVHGEYFEAIQAMRKTLWNDLSLRAASEAELDACRAAKLTVLMAERGRCGDGHAELTEAERQERIRRAL